MHGGKDLHNLNMKTIIGKSFTSPRDSNKTTGLRAKPNKKNYIRWISPHRKIEFIDCLTGNKSSTPTPTKLQIHFFTPAIHVLCLSIYWENLYGDFLDGMWYPLTCFTSPWYAFLFHLRTPSNLFGLGFRVDVELLYVKIYEKGNGNISWRTFIISLRCDKFKIWIC